MRDQAGSGQQEDRDRRSEVRKTPIHPWERLSSRDFYKEKSSCLDDKVNLR